jgi:hypothetical protein
VKTLGALPSEDQRLDDTTQLAGRGATRGFARASFTGERLTDDSGKLVLTRVSLHRSEGFGRRELCGADRREESGDGADEDGGGEAACPGAGGDDGGPVFG